MTKNVQKLELTIICPMTRILNNLKHLKTFVFVYVVTIKQRFFYIFVFIFSAVNRIEICKTSVIYLSLFPFDYPRMYIF